MERVGETYGIDAARLREARGLLSFFDCNRDDPDVLLDALLAVLLGPLE